MGNTTVHSISSSLLFIKRMNVEYSMSHRGFIRFEISFSTGRYRREVRTYRRRRILIICLSVCLSVMIRRLMLVSRESKAISD